MATAFVNELCSSVLPGSALLLLSRRTFTVKLFLLEILQVLREKRIHLKNLLLFSACVIQNLSSCWLALLDELPLMITDTSLKTKQHSR